MTERISFELPLPLSVNKAYRNRTTLDYLRGRRGGRYLTKSHNQWRLTCGQTIGAQRAEMAVKRVAGRYKLSIECSRRWGGDLGNAEKPISDLLVWMDVVDDDAKAEEIHLSWADVEGCVVTVEAAA